CSATPRVHLALPPSPTRRSSDLGKTVDERRGACQHWLIGRQVEDGVARCKLAGSGRHRQPVARQGRLQGFQHLVVRVVSLRLERDRKSTRLNSSHVKISYAVFCL